MTHHTKHLWGLLLLPSLAACWVNPAPEGLAKAQPARTTVKMDFYHRPLPELPLPNDIATRPDPEAATGRRVNASMIAPTQLERRVRELLDKQDGWGVFQPITIPFSGPLDVDSILAGHRDADFEPSNDVIYLVDVDRDSPDFGKLQHLDVGNGNYPVVMERFDYWDNGLREDSLSLFYEETDEDTNANGLLDPGEDANRNGALDPGEDKDNDGLLDPPEDTDADGVLDVPNYLPGKNPARDDLAARADALMTFYEKETNTLIVRPMVPLRERTTYAVVVTRRLKDANGDPVGSPYEYVNHTAQTEALEPLKAAMPQGLKLDDVAFAFTFTTQSLTSDWVAVREGLYGYGVQKHLAQEFPAELNGLEDLRSADRFPDAKNLKILYNEQWKPVLEQLADIFFGIDRGSYEYKALLESQNYIDYHIVGSFKSPQLFARSDDQGNPLPLNDQSWPVDLSSKPAPARAEDVHFWLIMPRKEISARGQGKPAPVVILGHGYSSNRLEALAFVGYLVRNGFAVLAIDNVSHGLALDEDQKQLARLLLKGFGLEPFFEAMFKGRAFDQNNDGVGDSGADFWTSYLFHTRDVVRQSLLDYVQLIRILKTFDGQRRWGWDLNGDGANELAGDFDGDGQVDVGADSFFGATGGSLGGIMSSMLGAVEPHMDVVAPISGGGGLSDIGLRSVQGGVREAVILRVLGPLFLGNLDPATETLALTAVIPDLNDDASLPLGAIQGVKVGDTLRVINDKTGEIGCGYVDPTGRIRVAVASDQGDPLRLEHYRGPALAVGDTECGLVQGATPETTVDSFGVEITFQGEVIPASTKLYALGDGLGLRRSNPEIRRFLGIGQMVLDGADPAVYARHFSAEPLVYPNMTQRTHTHAMIVTTLGDMSVPASSGVTLGRAAGFIDYLNVDPRLGTTPNQALLDDHVAEAVHSYKRYTWADAGEVGVHLDVENFSQGTDLWGENVPRRGEPMHLWSKTNAYGKDLGGYSGAIFPYPIPEGQHGFPFPGQLPDEAKENCERACPEGQDCQCQEVKTFDTGFFLFNMMGKYFRTRGQQVPTDLCLSDGSCADEPRPPTPRDVRELNAR